MSKTTITVINMIILEKTHFHFRLLLVSSSLTVESRSHGFRNNLIQMQMSTFCGEQWQRTVNVGRQQEECETRVLLADCLWSSARDRVMIVITRLHHQWQEGRNHWMWRQRAAEQERSSEVRLGTDLIMSWRHFRWPPDIETCIRALLNSLSLYSSWLQYFLVCVYIYNIFRGLCGPSCWPGVKHKLCGRGVIRSVVIALSLAVLLALIGFFCRCMMSMIPK